MSRTYDDESVDTTKFGEFKMKIIKHGNMYKDRLIKCLKCGCVFGFNDDDIKVSHFRYMGGYVFETLEYIECPECEAEIRIVRQGQE